jgi:hypothetical protein
MGRSELTLKDLRAELADFEDRHPQLSADDLFLAWFMRAYITDDEDAAVEALAGGARDKSIDAIFVDHAARTVFVVQAKYRRALEAKTEQRNDLLGFARLADVICKDDHAEFNQFVSNMEPLSADLLKDARQRVLKGGYRLWLYYVTLGRVTPGLEKEVAKRVGKAHPDAAMEVLAGKKIMLLLRDYLDGAAPPIPTLDLEMESGDEVTVNGILQRYDERSDIESWVFSMRGNMLADVFERSGPRLFARNIRGFMGRTPVNEGMVDTLSAEPRRFFYYNNGITVVCDRAERISNKGRDILRVGNPQIINGQQTSRVLAEEVGRAEHATVLVKVIRVPRDEHQESSTFDELVSRIVQGTNWQNAIKPSDLMSNDRRQIQIERALRKLGYGYLRKREKKSEARRKSGGKRMIMIKKEDLAQAVAGCDLDPVIARSGKDNLFEEQYYKKVFPHLDVDAYLSRFWLARVATYGAKGFPRRGYMKWLVLGFTWKRLAPLVRSRVGATAFRQLCERNRIELLSPLDAAVDRVYRAATAYYRKNRGQGEKQADPSLFFRSKKGRDREFEHFWGSKANRERGRFKRNWARVVAAIEQGSK